MSLQQFKDLLAIRLNQKYQPPTIDMTQDNYTGRYTSGLNSIFVPDISSF